jgi:hypothetical protein
MRRWTVPLVSLACCAALGGASTRPAEEGVKLLAGFEWDEVKAGLERFHYIGRPFNESPPLGWKGQRIEDLADVGADGFQVIDATPSSSREYPRQQSVRTGATQGQFAFRSHLFGADPVAKSRTRYLEQGLKEKFPPPWPVYEVGYDVHDHWFQRECQVYRQGWDALTDWSGYERLRFDVTAAKEPIQLGVRVRDGAGPRLPPGPTGLRTPVAVFTVPPDETVTCDLPLAELAAAGELDLKRIHRWNIRVNGLPSGKAPDALYLDNLRLVAKGAETRPAHRLIPMNGAVGPFARPVWVRPPTVRDAERLKRAAGPVDALGPVVVNPTALYAGPLGHGSGHFGCSGATYFTNSRRAVVAYDNQRLCLILGGGEGPAGRASQPSRRGTLAIASFDGGRTWSGLAPEDKDFTILPWFLRSNFSADQFGHLYAIGTPNCDSYNEGQDICLHRLAFTGETWVDDRMAVLHQDGYKCPALGHALSTPSGRLWAAWNDGFGGCLARSSDDDGFTWQPCKDASLPAPRPFYQPDLAKAGKTDQPAPPKSVLLWPSGTVPGPMLTPYKGHVAVFSGEGESWAFHDGVKWSETRKGVKIGRLLTVTTLGDDHVFLCRGAAYSDLGNELFGDLAVADLQPDGSWKTETLESEKTVTSAIVTASGAAVFCFYVKKAADDRYEVLQRRWQSGTWAPPVRLAVESKRINHLAAPQVCPPDYAALFWDQHFAKPGDPSEVKFMRVPNR